MTRTIVLLVAVTGGCLLFARLPLAQIFAQTPAGAGAAAPAPADDTRPPQTPTAPRAVNPPVPVPLAGLGSSGGRAVIYAGAGGHSMAIPFHGHGEHDPEVSKLMQSEHELARETEQLTRSYASTEDYQEREKLKGQLRGLLEKQFDAQRQRRELELKRVEERLARLRDQLRKRNDLRNTIIDRHLETLISDAEGLGWSTPGAGGGFSFGASSEPFFAPQGPGRTPRVAR